MLRCSQRYCVLSQLWKQRMSLFQYEGHVFLTQRTFLGDHHTERAWWQGTSTRKGCKTAGDPDHRTFTCPFSALRHIKIKPPQGTGLSGGGGCPRPREHQVLLSLGPTCPLLSTAGQPPRAHSQPQEMGAGGGEGTCWKRAPWGQGDLWASVAWLFLSFSKWRLTVKCAFCLSSSPSVQKLQPGPQNSGFCLKN